MRVMRFLKHSLFTKRVSKLYEKIDQITQRFIQAKPVLHVTAAILTLGLLQLIPPIISELLLSNHERLSSDMNSPPVIPCILGRDDKDSLKIGSNRAHRNCAESLLALGFKIDLDSVDQTDLELIPGISSRLSAAIMKDRDKILEDARELNINQRYQALQRVKGIGEAISLRLDELITLDRSHIEPR